MLTIHFKDNSKAGGWDEGSDPIATIKGACSERGWKFEDVRGYSLGERIRRPVNIGIEHTRTTAGNKLFDQIHNGKNTSEAFAEVKRRIEVRIENIRADSDGAAGEVWTRLDGGEWENEGDYILSHSFEYTDPEVVEI